MSSLQRCTATISNLDLLPVLAKPADRLRAIASGTPDKKARLTLEVGNEVLCDVLPCLEALDEDVRGAQVGWACRAEDQYQLPRHRGKEHSPLARLMSCDCLEVTELLRETRECLEAASLSMSADGWVDGVVE